MFQNPLANAWTQWIVTVSPVYLVQLVLTMNCFDAVHTMRLFHVNHARPQPHMGLPCFHVRIACVVMLFHHSLLCILLRDR